MGAKVAPKDPQLLPTAANRRARLGRARNWVSAVRGGVTRSDSGSCVWLPGNHDHQWTRPDGVGRPSASQQASQIAWRACANGSQPSSKNAVLNRSAASMSAAVVTSYSPLVTASLASSVRTHVTETEAACGSRARIT